MSECAGLSPLSGTSLSVTSPYKGFPSSPQLVNLCIFLIYMNMFYGPCHFLHAYECDRYVGPPYVLSMRLCMCLSRVLGWYISLLNDCIC